jgi:glycosyltransferase involved in cell wall biosynthesis
MANKVQRKQFLFFRRIPAPPKGEYGGLEKLMFDWFERIDYAATEVVVVVTTGWKERFQKEAQQRGLPLTVEELPFDYFKVGPVQRFWDMRHFLKNYRPSGIIFFQAYFEEFGLPELMVARWKAKGNVFMHENMGTVKPPENSSKKHFGVIPGAGLWWQYYMFCIRSRADLSKNILTVSQEIKNRYVSWWGYAPKKVLVTHHGVDSKDFSPDAKVRMSLRQKFKLPEKDRIFIIIARFTPIKRLDRAIRAFNIIFQRSPDVRLVLVGSGPLDDECRQIAGALPCSGHVLFIGHVHDPANYLKMADIFVLSSDSEGLSIALMEAMASGLIVISTDCSGSDEVITDGKTGFIVSKTDESLADGMQKALDLTLDECRNMRQAGMRFIQKEFDIDTNVLKVFKIMGITH